jgi:hypothetical protein
MTRDTLRARPLAGWSHNLRVTGEKCAHCQQPLSIWFDPSGHLDEHSKIRASVWHTGTGVEECRELEGTP